MFLRPVIIEGRTEELNLLLYKKGSGTGPGCSLTECANVTGAILSSLASVERISMKDFYFSQ